VKKENPMGIANANSLRTIFAAALLLLLVSVAGGCDELESASRVEIGMVETGGLNSTRARFQTFTGNKIWREALEEGDALSLKYEADVEKGLLILQVENPDDEVVWERELEEGDSVGDDVQLNAAQDGTYIIIVQSDGAGGNYSLAWDEIE
jgi:hypothetical protein